jgi:predicted unusual protein kinase regulating ubiquinone biosynthesis (AarF/ABC1/UbiB family)
VRTRNAEQKKSEAARLRRLRDALGLNQRELSREFNVTHGAVAGWESGKRTIPGPVLRLMDLYEEELGVDPVDHGLRRLKTSKGARTLELSRAGLDLFTRVGASLLERVVGEPERRGVVARRTQGVIGKNLTETLGGMKGAAMKLGQVLAYSEFALPDAVRSELRALFTQSAPLAPSVVARLFVEELGESPRQVFAEWNSKPFAAASIGQVHQARLRSGETVAVKIQYPAIVEAIKADLDGARIVDRLATLIFRGQEPGVWSSELSERFFEECDYRVEARNQEEFRGLWARRRGFRVPRVFAELSTQRILVSELGSGQSLDEFAATAERESRNRAGIRIWQFAFESIFRHGLFNADPHPGNYLFDGETVIFLDFGCVKRFSSAHVASWKQLIRAILERDLVRACELVSGFGMAPKGFDFDYHARLLAVLYEPWLTDEPFEFTPEAVQRTWAAITSENPNRFRFNVPKDWVVVNRLHWGMCAVLGQLRVRARFRPLMLDLLYAPGEARPKPYSRAEMSLLAGRAQSGQFKPRHTANSRSSKLEASTREPSGQTTDTPSSSER